MTTPTTVPALVRASTVRDLLASVGAADLPSRYTVCAIGLYNHRTGDLLECDTTAFYKAFDVTSGERITLGDTVINVNRKIVVYNDLDD